MFPSLQRPSCPRIGAILLLAACGTAEGADGAGCVATLGRKRDPGLSRINMPRLAA